MSSAWTEHVCLLSARRLQQYVGTQMPVYTHAEALRWDDRQSPALVLFVSHRWQTTQHPDADGTALRTIQTVLDALDELTRGLDPTCGTAAPDLNRPGMLHASVLLYRMLDECFDGRTALDRVAVFYDFSCLPQGGRPEQQQQLHNSLAHFPSMIPDACVSLLALRSTDDRYADRAWCVAESSLSLTYRAGRPWVMTFPMRIELMPQRQPIGFSDLAEAIDSWTTATDGLLEISEAQFEAWIDIVQLCVDWFRRARPEATERLHHSHVMADRSFRLHVTTMVRLAEHGSRIVELEPVLRMAAEEEGLMCTNPDDIVPTTLLALSGLRWEQLNRDSGRPREPSRTDADFFEQALLRYVARRPLTTRVELRPSSVDGQLCPPALSFAE